jgi:uncharacterized protein (TIGR03437 family)
MYRFSLSLLASLVCFLPAFASNIVVLPQENSGNTTGYIYSPEPFNQIGTFATDALAFEAVWHPNGQKFYVFSKSVTKSITVYSGTAPYGEITSRSLPNISTAKISPDGQRLVVLSQAVRIYDTATDQEITGINSCGDTPCTPVDVDFAPDSSRAYILNSNGSIAAINLGNNTIGSRLSLSNGPSTLMTGPNGLLYVTAQNALLEIDGRENITQIGNEIPLVGSNCLRTQFTPDGSRAVIACNVIGSTQIYVVDITTRTVSQATIANAVAERFKVISNSSALYYIGVSNTVYRGGLVAPLSNPIQLELAGTGLLTGGRYLVTSDEQPTNRYFFSNVNNTLSRINLETNSLNSSLSQPTFIGPSFFTGRAPTGIPFSLITINPTQNVIQGTRGRPLVVRVLDNATRPLSGVTVNFASTSQAIQFDSTAAISNKDGYAMVNYTAPTVTGTYTITASASGVQGQGFTLNVTNTGNPGGPGGPGGPTGPQPIEIVSGNGQIVLAQFLAPQPLTVRLRDGSGAPQANVTVNWAVQSGDGNVTLATTTTDAQGLAQTQYGSVLFYNDGFNGPRVATIRASSANGSVDFIVTSYPSSGPPPLLLPANPPNITLLSPAENSTIRVQAGTTTAGAIKARILSGTLAGFATPIQNIGFFGTTGNEPEVGPTATCSPTNLSNGQGEATCDIIAGPRLGQANFQVCLGNCNNPGRSFNFNIEVVPGPPGVIVKRQGDNQSGGPGTLTPLALRGTVTDSFGNRLGGVTVRVEVISGEATIESLFNTTNSDGDFSFLVRFGSSPGEVRIRTSAGDAQTIWTLTNNVSIGNFVKVGGDNQTTVVGRPFATPLGVQLFDAQGRAISGATVTFAVQSGQATLSATSAVTNSQGVASVTATAGANPGAISISASAVNRVVTFSLTAVPPGPTITSVVNAAGFQEGLAPCGLATVFGSNLATGLTGSVVGNSFVGPLPLALRGVSIQIAGRTAPILSVSNIDGREQVTFQVPCEAPAGATTMRVQVSEGASSVPVTVSLVNPGIFETTDSSGRRVGVIVRSNGTYMTRENPAARGENVIGFFTGLGQLVTPITTNNPGAYTDPSPVAAQVIIGVNNEGVPVLSATMAPGLVGIYIVQFQIPQGAATGLDRPYAIGVIGADGVYAPGNPSAIHVQ